MLEARFYVDFTELSSVSSTFSAALLGSRVSVLRTRKPLQGYLPMVLLKGSSWQSRLRERLLDEARAQNLAYLAYLFTPGHGSEAIAVAVGKCPEGPHARMVSALTSSEGRAELHWPSGIDYSPELAAALLQELESGRQSDHPSLSARLHATICQSLTAAHLHLELGLMSRPEAGEEFVVARELVHEATTSVRDLIDDLAGQSP